MSRICLIEDDLIMGESLVERFRLEGFDACWCRDGATAMHQLSTRPFDVVVSDMRLGDTSGEALFDWAGQTLLQRPPFLFITGFGSIDQAVELIKRGAYDYLTKPFDLDELIGKINALGGPGDSGQQAPLGISVAMRQIEALIERLAKATDTVLIAGESGVGKERVAERLHAAGSKSPQAPFIAVNCGAIPEQLLEAELFGHEKGAFTGAHRSRPGVFEQANGGTLFLDEIGEMSLAMQVKLLRVIQERRVTRVGGERALPLSLLLICATHRDLRTMVTEGGFREDLFYRVNVGQIRIPPLRERRDDILWLIEQFLDEVAARSEGPRHRLHPGAVQAISHYPWPGNVRELRHAVERACIMSRSPWLTQELLLPASGVAPATTEPDAPLGDYLRDCERRYILSALANHQGQVALTAEQLGISRKNLWEKMKKLGIGDNA